MSDTELSEEQTKYEVGCPRQGVETRLMSLEEIGEWMDREATFWGEIRAPTELQFENHRPAIRSISHVYADFWADLRNDLSKAGSGQRLGSALTAADSLDLILSEGHIAKEISHERQLPHGALEGVLLFSRYLWEALNLQPPLLEYFQGQLIVSKMHPAMHASADLLGLETVLAESSERETASREYMAELKAELETRRSELALLEKTYSEKLKLEAPAKYWSQIASRSSWAAAVWLALFIGTVLGVAYYLVQWWAALSGTLSSFLKDAGIGGVAFISIVALGLGWILKHFSRGFVQNMQSAADARHRKVMVMTYLGLAKDPDTEISNAERALILNALFRPAPPHSNDSGPPAGILEILRKD